MKKHFESVFWPILTICVLFIVYIIQVLVLSPNNCYGIIPLNTQGLRGILYAPLLHGSWQHLVNNAFNLVIVMFLLFQFYNKTAYAVIIIGWLFTGLFVWLIPSYDIHFGIYTSCHIGASGLIYVMASFLFFGGFFARNIKLIAISLLVAYLNQGMLFGILPQEFFGTVEEGNRISWQSHLGGFIIGTVLAFIFRKKAIVEEDKPKLSPEQSAIREQEIWEQYKEQFPEDFDDTKPEEPKKKTWDDLL